MDNEEKNHRVTFGYAKGDPNDMVKYICICGWGRATNAFHTEQYKLKDAINHIRIHFAGVHRKQEELQQERQAREAVSSWQYRRL